MYEHVVHFLLNGGSRFFAHSTTFSFQNWSEAVKLAEEHAGKFDDSVFLPYALWLRDKGRFDEALGAFLKAGRRDLSRDMTERLM